MGKIVYSMHVSLDGYIEDAEGGIGFSVPADDVHQAANEQTEAAAVLLFGRRLFEMMEGPWAEIAAKEDVSEVEAEFARVYFATPRIVFSDTLRCVPEGVRLVRSADAVDEVKRLKREVPGTLEIGGAQLAASMVDLVDEFRLVVFPVILGGGKPYFPPAPVGLRLIEHRAFPSGTVLLRYERA
ncbi:dihydrofolate reductase family protein [Sinosporangium siamense]|uniref:Deaminase n=1 Tax=Sinosporangium siamense TaxID=1367973 RepID=A0A919RIG5_9ACTN|nr:dihydrofolate reductase family protein [Sinosporangium siamense]GII94423.1 deaminase [Sinosporangium siamense]